MSSSEIRNHGYAFDGIIAVFTVNPFFTVRVEM